MWGAQTTNEVLRLTKPSSEPPIHIDTPKEMQILAQKGDVQRGPSTLLVDAWMVVVSELLGQIRPSKISDYVNKMISVIETVGEGANPALGQALLLSELQSLPLEQWLKRVDDVHLLVEVSGQMASLLYALGHNEPHAHLDPVQSRSLIHERCPHLKLGDLGITPQSLSGHQYSFKKRIVTRRKGEAKQWVANEFIRAYDQTAQEAVQQARQAGDFDGLLICFLALLATNQALMGLEAVAQGRKQTLAQSFLVVFKLFFDGANDEEFLFPLTRRMVGQGDLKDYYDSYHRLKSRIGTAAWSEVLPQTAASLREYAEHLVNTGETRILLGHDWLPSEAIVRTAQQLHRDLLKQTKLNLQRRVP